MLEYGCPGLESQARRASCFTRASRDYRLSNSHSRADRREDLREDSEAIHGMLVRSDVIEKLGMARHV